MSEFAHDVRYALRTLGRQPLFAAIAVGLLGLALDANTAMVALAKPDPPCPAAGGRPRRIAAADAAHRRPAADPTVALRE